MPTNSTEGLTPCLRPHHEAAVREVLACPEHEALRLYARLSTAMRWQARLQATGQRRTALIQHHVMEFAQLR